MFTQRSFLLLAALCGVAFATPTFAQPPSASEPVRPASDLGLEAFVRDATTFTALPWQRDALGLTSAQVAALGEISTRHRGAIHELYYEIRALFEAVARLDKPVDAREAYALYDDLTAHKVEALREYRAGAESMRAILTDAQQAEWERMLEAAAGERAGPVQD